MAGKLRRNGDLVYGSVRLTWDQGSTTAGAQDTTTVNIPGAKVGDAVTVTCDAPQSGFVYDGYVSATGTVTVRGINASGSTANPASKDFTVSLLRI